ncbi:hypothetical protein OIM90_24010 [Streptomyces sp. AD16]|nr:hypothetical protein OIM90_24010 [Streptomyces sp. AD16]
MRTAPPTGRVRSRRPRLRRWGPARRSTTPRRRSRHRYARLLRLPARHGPLSVCLAVLAALTVGLLLRAGGLLWRGVAPGSAARALLTGRRGGQWPIAPPTRLALARLSVLRI